MVFDVVDAAFAQRRKTLRAALAGGAGSPTPVAEVAVRRAWASIRSVRGETLSVEELRASPNSAVA